jgi:glycosyltransferase involved in cell wall biosynthesis
MYDKIAKSIGKHTKVTVIGIYSGEIEEIQNIKILPFRKCKRKISACTLSNLIGIYMSAVRENADIYHLHTPELIPLGCMLKKRGKLVMYDKREYENVFVRGHFVLKTVRWGLNNIFKFLEYIAFRRFDLIICNTQGIFEASKGNKCVVANFVDLESMKKIRAKKNKIFSVAYIGGLSADRCILKLVQAVGELNKEGVHVQLHLAGWWEKGLKKKCQNTKRWKYTRDYGMVSPKEAYKIARGCHVGICVLEQSENYMEGWAVKVFEYMGLGLPVIGTDFPKWREFYGETICFVPPTKDGIKEGIKKFYGDDQLRKKYMKKSKSFVGDGHNWASQEEVLLDKIEELL